MGVIDKKMRKVFQQYFVDDFDGDVVQDVEELRDDHDFVEVENCAQYMFSCEGRPSVPLSDFEARSMICREIDQLLDEYPGDNYHYSGSNFYVVTITPGARVFVTFESARTARMVRSRSEHMHKCFLQAKLSHRELSSRRDRNANNSRNGFSGNPENNSADYGRPVNRFHVCETRIEHGYCNDER